MAGVRCGTGEVCVSDPGTAFGKSAPTYINAQGGRHSRSPCALDVTPMALLRVGRVLYQGEQKYETELQTVGQENWRRISPRMHVRHAVNHLFAWLAGNRDDEHLEHAVCRLLFAVELDRGVSVPIASKP